MWRLLLIPLAATLLAATPAPSLDPAEAIEVEAVVPIVDGNAVGARDQALAGLFGEAVAVAAEGEAGVGSLADRPAVAKQLRAHARDYLEAYQILADTYRLGGAEAPAVGTPAAGTLAAGATAATTPAGPPDLPPPTTGDNTAALSPLPAPQMADLPDDHYLVRLRVWVDRARLRTALGLHPRSEADLAIEVHTVDGMAATAERLELLRAHLATTLGERGWRLGEGETPHRLEVEAAADFTSTPERRQVTIALTGRLQTEAGVVEALLQGHGSSTFANLDFAWGEAQEQAVADLVDHLLPLLPPPHAVTSDRWIEVILAPLPSYGAGLELADLIRDRAEGATEVQRGTYARRALHLRVRTAGDATTLATAIAALHWRDFTLHAQPRTPTEVQVEVQRF